MAVGRIKREAKEKRERERGEEAERQRGKGDKIHNPMKP